MTSPETGKADSLILSSDRKQRLRGLQVLHRRFWHAKLQDMKLLLERGGVDILDEEIKSVITACPVCRKWQKPPLAPRVKVSLPENFNDEVDFDFMCYKVQPIASLSTTQSDCLWGTPLFRTRKKIALTVFSNGSSLRNRG